MRRGINHGGEKIGSLWEYAPTAMTSLSYRRVKWDPVLGDRAVVASGSEPDCVSKERGGVAGICSLFRRSVI